MYIRKQLFKFIFHESDACIFVSQSLANAFLTKELCPQPNKVYVIYNPIVPSDLEKKIEEPIMHSWLSLKNKPVILAIGRFVREKSFDYLIESFHYLKNIINIDARLIILGDGEERVYLEELVKKLSLEDCIDMPGVIHNVWPYLSKADVFVLSSKMEALGIVLVEALACGTNVVSTDCLFGPSEILEDGKFGRLVMVGDVNGMAVAIKETLSHPMPSELLKQRAMDFSVNRSVEMYDKLILSLISSK
jgi:glycosyltransferase involved in cell wall biosynthesis